MAENIKAYELAKKQREISISEFFLEKVEIVLSQTSLKK